MTTETITPCARNVFDWEIQIPDSISNSEPRCVDVRFADEDADRQAADEQIAEWER